MLKRATTILSIFALGACTGVELEGSNIDDIVGGEDVDISERPWQISMQTTSGFHFCGGSIIDESWILSAAHCVDGQSASRIRIAAGITRVSTSGNQGQLVDVSEIIMFPGYSNPAVGKDAALLRLAQPLDLSGPSARAIEIITADDVAAGLTEPGVTTTISGWGTLSSGGSSPDILQTVDVPLVSNEEAQEAYSNETITDDQLAAGFMGVGGKDACQGDSGGPLVVPDVAGGYKLAGIVSWGYGCADAQFPGMYARVSSFETWIIEAVGGGDNPGGGDEVVALDERNLGDSQGGFIHFPIEVPEGASNLTIDISGGSGDADLYVRQGAEPTTSAYDCRPYRSGNAENCTFASPGAGVWFVSVRAYSTYAGLNLSATYIARDGGDNPGGGDKLEESNLSASTGNWLQYTLEVPAGTASVGFVISGGDGDADLYVQHGAEPTRTSYVCRPYRWGNEETCTINNPTAGTWHVGVRAYSNFSGLSLTGEY